MSSTTKTLVITDLTHMPEPDAVCVVGKDTDGRNIRPVLSGGFKKSFLYRDGKLVIRPKARIRFDLYEIPVNPPHIEDMGFDEKSLAYDGLCTDVEWDELLRSGSFTSVGRMFDGHLEEHRWVLPGARTRSIGTLSHARVREVRLFFQSRSLRNRLSFVDNTGHLYNMPVSDLAFRMLSQARVQQYTRLSRSLDDVARHIIDLLQRTDRLYLRVGLARPWANSGPRKCWTQITGIHTFPDYLGGKSFADF